MNIHTPDFHSNSSLLFAPRAACVDDYHYETPLDKVLLRRVTQLTLGAESRKSGELLMVTGPEGAGKGELLRQLANAECLAPFTGADGQPKRPFFLLHAGVQLGAHKQLIADGVLGLKEPTRTHARKGAARHGLNQAVLAITQSDHRVIAITHFEGVLNTKDLDSQATLAATLATVMEETKASIILTGGPAIVAFAREHEELIGAASHYPLAPTIAVDDVAAMVSGLEEVAGLESDPALRDERVLTAILEYAQGLRGRVAQLLKEATKAAAFDDVNISPQHLVEVADATARPLGEKPLSRLLQDLGVLPIE